MSTYGRITTEFDPDRNDWVAYLDGDRRNQTLGRSEPEAVGLLWLRAVREGRMPDQAALLPTIQRFVELASWVEETTPDTAVEHFGDLPAEIAAAEALLKQLRGEE